MNLEGDLLPADTFVHTFLRQSVEDALKVLGVGAVHASYARPDDRLTLTQVRTSPGQLWLVTDLGIAVLDVRLADTQLGASVEAELTPFVDVGGLRVRTERQVRSNPSGADWVEWVHVVHSDHPALTGTESRPDTQRQSAAFEELRAFGKALLERLPV